MDAHNTHYHISACVHVFGNDLKLATEAMSPPSATSRRLI